MLDVRLFRNRRFSAASGSITLAFFALFGTMFFLTQYLQLVLGYGAFESGVRLMPVAAGLIVGGPLSAKLVERVGTKRVVAAGLMLVGGRPGAAAASRRSTPATASSPRCSASSASAWA